MPSKNHLIEIDRPTGDEYIAGADDIFSPDFFIYYGEESTYEKLYNQLEFAKTYGTNLCTIYGPMTTLSIIMGRELTSDERLELVKLRVAQSDFNLDVGGYTSIGVDVMRRWYNLKFPSDPIRTAMVNEAQLLKTLAQKNIPITTSLRGNRRFTLDTVDGTMDYMDYWNFPKTYGHCRTRRKLDVLDNYSKKYRYKTISDLELCLSHSFESSNVFVVFKESSLSIKGKRYLQGMKDGIWNGERAGSNITRYEASRMAMRLNTLVKEKDIWNGKDGQKEASIYEVTLMLSKTSSVHVYLGPDRNKLVSRGDTVEMIYSGV